MGEEVLGRDEVLSRVRARVLAAARRFLPAPEAEDAAQGALLLLTTKYAHVAAAEELVAIGARIVHWKRVAYWRKVARRRALGESPAPAREDGRDAPPDEAASTAPDPERLAHDRQRLALLVEATGRLGGRCRSLLRRKLEGASFAEIASELGKSVNTVYSWDHRCRQRLKSLLGERWSFVAGTSGAEDGR